MMTTHSWTAPTKKLEMMNSSATRSSLITILLPQPVFFLPVPTTELDFEELKKTRPNHDTSQDDQPQSWTLKCKKLEDEEDEATINNPTTTMTSQLHDEHHTIWASSSGLFCPFTTSRAHKELTNYGIIFCNQVFLDYVPSSATSLL